MFLCSSAVLGLLAISLTAFSRNSKEVIHNRDNWKCVKCGCKDTSKLEAAHIDHSKGSSRYNNPANGRTLCTDCHLKDHVNRHGSNGLPKNQNEWSIKMLKRRTG